jgi:two-component system phosphate regulon sensor histidine kinase PhoR
MTEDKDSFIAEVSHELRLPLANIKLLVETLLDGALEDPITARHMLGRAKEEVQRLQLLVSDLLSHEKLKGPRFDMRFERVNIHERALYAIETTRELSQSRAVKVELEVPETFELQADMDQINQVLVNLVENAIKFTPEGGLVTIRAGSRAGGQAGGHISGSAGGSACGGPPFIEVEDTGIGMAEVEIPKIFQRFYRVDRGRTRGSTGLGLSIVKHIADLHGAKIAVSSKEGTGTKFTIEFPESADLTGQPQSKR